MTDDSARGFSRKAFLAGSAALAAGLRFARPAGASNASAAMSPDAALAKLKAGNAVFVRDMTQTRMQTIAERAALGAGQAPFASILSCADSRTAPEIVFNQGLGDLFVVRVAGNVATATEVGSLEYGAAELKSPLIVVMGHSGCGAVKAAIELTKGEKFPGSIQTLVTLIEPAVREAQREGGDLVVNATKENVEQSVETLEKSPILSGLMKSGALKIVGAYYEIASGKVTFL
jgi:carbonic anhydrase